MSQDVVGVRVIADTDPSVRADNRERLLAYNEDDCRATRALRDWLTQEGATLKSVEEL